MKITDETIEYVAALAKLQLSEDEKEKAKEDLSKILGYMETMNELNTDEVEPMSHVFSVKNVMREDEVTNGNDQEALLQNAPRKKDGSYMVPKTVE